MPVNSKNPFSRGAQKICTSIIEVPTPLRKEERKHIRLVSISLNKLERNIHAFSNDLDFPYQHIVGEFDQDGRNLLLDHFKQGINHAVNKFKADIICINELGMPVDQNGDVSLEAIEFAKDIANRHNCLIIAGTMHCRHTFLNKGYIFYPKEGDNPKDEYFKYYKNVSATGAGEFIYTPSERKLFRTQAFGIGIAALICLEIADYSSVAVLAQSKEVIDLVIVPCYLDEYGPMGKAARNLSIPVGGVLLNNCYSTSHNPDSQLFLNGEEGFACSKTHLIESKIGSSKYQSLVGLRKITVKKFKAEKREIGLKLPDHINLLYGIKGFIHR